MRERYDATNARIENASFGGRWWPRRDGRFDRLISATFKVVSVVQEGNEIKSLALQNRAGGYEFYSDARADGRGIGPQDITIIEGRAGSATVNIYSNAWDFVCHLALNRAKEAIPEYTSIITNDAPPPVVVQAVEDIRRDSLNALAESMLLAHQMNDVMLMGLEIGVERIANLGTILQGIKERSAAAAVAVCPRSVDLYLPRDLKGHETTQQLISDLRAPDVVDKSDMYRGQLSLSQYYDRESQTEAER